MVPIIHTFNVSVRSCFSYVSVWSCFSYVSQVKNGWDHSLSKKPLWKLPWPAEFFFMDIMTFESLLKVCYWATRPSLPHLSLKSTFPLQYFIFARNLCKYLCIYIYIYNNVIKVIYFLNMVYLLLCSLWSETLGFWSLCPELSRPNLYNR